jgi:hypothetical protein
VAKPGIISPCLGLVRILEAWRDEQVAAREYTTLLNLQARWIDRELKGLGWPVSIGPARRIGCPSSEASFRAAGSSLAGGRFRVRPDNKKGP